MPRKRNVWSATLSIKRQDGTIAKIAEIADVNGTLGVPKVTWFISEEERAAHTARIMARIATAAADMKDAEGNPLLPNGTYNVMDLLRS